MIQTAVAKQWRNGLRQNYLGLVHSAKQPASFNNDPWKRDCNPDFVFVSSCINSHVIKGVFFPISRIQHRQFGCTLELVWPLSSPWFRAPLHTHTSPCHTRPYDKVCRGSGRGQSESGTEHSPAPTTASWTAS